MTTHLLFSRIFGSDGTGGTPLKRIDPPLVSGSTDFRALFRTMTSGVQSSPASQTSALASLSVAPQQTGVAQLAFSTLLSTGTGAALSAFTASSVQNSLTRRTQSTRQEEPSRSIDTNTRQVSAPDDTSPYSSATASLGEDRLSTLPRMTLQELVRQALRQATRTSTPKIIPALSDSPVSTSQGHTDILSSIRTTITTDSNIEVSTAKPIPMNTNTVKSKSILSTDDSFKRIDKNLAIDESPAKLSEQDTDLQETDTKMIDSDNTEIKKTNYQDASQPNIDALLILLGSQLLQSVQKLQPNVMHSVSGNADAVQMISSALSALQEPLTKLAGAVDAVQNQALQIEQILGIPAPTLLTVQPTGNGTFALALNLPTQSVNTPLAPEQIAQWQSGMTTAVNTLNTALTDIVSAVQTQMATMPQELRQTIQKALQQELPRLVGQGIGAIGTHDGAAQALIAQTLSPSASIGSVSPSLLSTVITMAMQTMTTITTAQQSSVGILPMQSAGLFTSTDQISPTQQTAPHITQVFLQIESSAILAPLVSSTSISSGTFSSTTSLPTLGDIAQLVKAISTHDTTVPVISIALFEPTTDMAANTVQNSHPSNTLVNNAHSLLDIPFPSAVGTHAVSNDTTLPTSSTIASPSSIESPNVAPLLSAETRLPLTISDLTAEKSTLFGTVANPAQPEPTAPPVAMSAVQQNIANTPASPFQATFGAGSPIKKNDPALNTFSHQAVAGTQTTQTTSAVQAVQTDAHTQHQPSSQFGGTNMLPSNSTGILQTLTDSHGSGFLQEITQAEPVQGHNTAQEAIGTGFENIDTKQAMNTKLPFEMPTTFAKQFVQVFKDIAPQDIPRTIMQGFRGLTPMAGGVGGAIQLQLNPEHLGGVMVQVLVKNMTASISIETDSADAQRAVEAHLSTLKEKLIASGLKVETVDVNTRPNNDSAHLDMNKQGQSSSQAQRDERQSRQTFLESFRHPDDSQRHERTPTALRESVSAHDIARRMKAGKSGAIDSSQRNFERYA